MQAIVERALEANPGMMPEEARPITIEELDYEFIEEVIDGCSQILQTVTEYAGAGSLRFLPVRPVYRIVTSSIFLLKALSIGVRHGQFQRSLDVLDRSIRALRSNGLDDMHCVPRYAILIEVHVARLRRHFVESSKYSRGRTTRPLSPSLAPVEQQRSATSNLNQEAPASGIDPDIPWPDLSADDWLYLPFDSSMAPFGLTGTQTCTGLEPSALDFMWNLSL
jgi:hypothetical protein